MALKLNIKPFSFQLKKELRTSRYKLNNKTGWLIRIEDNNGRFGWGEVSPIDTSEQIDCELILKGLEGNIERKKLEEEISMWPGSLGFGVGACLGELDGLIGKYSEIEWLNPPDSAILLTQETSLIEEIKYIIKKEGEDKNITLKWKVGINPIEEVAQLPSILEIIPENYKVRIDANGGWSYKHAEYWANSLINESRLDWLEQPLAPEDHKGLLRLSKIVPIAIDQSLVRYPSLRNSWKGWQVRRPSLEGDPRALLKELDMNSKYKMISTAFETGIGQRWIHHLSALQQKGLTPTAPGLAPGWCPKGNLFAKDPETVWRFA